MQLPTAILAAFVVSNVLAAPDDARCSFTARQPTATAPIAGPQELVRSASIMTQPDSPLAIVRLDISGTELQSAGGTFSRAGSFAMDVQNVSDQTITDASVSVFTGVGPSSGIGSGKKLGRALAPGETARVEWRAGSGRGSIASDRQVASVARVEQVVFSSCIYRPSQSWPASTSTSAAAK